MPSTGLNTLREPLGRLGFFFFWDSTGTPESEEGDLLGAATRTALLDWGPPFTQRRLRSPWAILRPGSRSPVPAGRLCQPKKAQLSPQDRTALGPLGERIAGPNRPSGGEWAEPRAPGSSPYVVSRAAPSGGEWAEPRAPASRWLLRQEGLWPAAFCGSAARALRRFAARRAQYGGGVAVQRRSAADRPGRFHRALAGGRQAGVRVA